MKKTYILFWNPAISSYKLKDFQREMEDLDNAYMNWSVWEYEKACAGDRFFMVRCGSGKTGICMSGYFSSDPYKDEDWSGKGRVTYYMNLEPDYMIHPDYLPILSTTDLVREVPGFDWNGGHSGRLLDAKLAEKLEAIWKRFTDEHADMFTMRATHQEVDPDRLKSKHSDEQIFTIELTEQGKLYADNYACDIEIEGDDLDDVKKQAIDAIYKELGEKPTIKFEYDDVDEEDYPMYEKTLKLVLANKKEGVVFDQSYWDYEEKVVYLLHKVGVSTLKLQKQGFPDGIIKAVKAIDRKPRDIFMAFVKRAAKNEIARVILKDEIYDALNINNKERLDEDDFNTLNENLAALRYLKSLEN